MTIKDSTLTDEEIIRVRLFNAQQEGERSASVYISKEEYATLAAQCAKSDAAWLSLMQGMADAARAVVNHPHLCTYSDRMKEELRDEVARFDKFKADLEQE